MIALISGVGLLVLFVLNLAYCIINRRDNSLFPLPYIQVVGMMPVAGLIALFQSVDWDKADFIVLSLDPRHWDPRIISFLGTSKFDVTMDLPMLLLTVPIAGWTAIKYHRWLAADTSRLAG